MKVFTSLTPAQCVERIDGRIDSEKTLWLSLKSIFGSRPVLGNASESRVRLRKRIRGRNSFQTILTAKLEPESGGTVVSIHTGIHRFVLVFGAIWLAIVGSVFTFQIQRMASHWTWTDAQPFLLAAPIVTGVVIYIRWNAHREAEFLTHFLIETLDAKPYLDPTQPYGT